MNKHLNQLQTIIATLDDRALEALANKGLLRRAEKDIKNGILIELSEATSDRIIVRVGELSVSFPPAGLAKAECSCSTQGVCQHILAACLFLRKNNFDASTPSEIQHEDLLKDRYQDVAICAQVHKELLGYLTEDLVTWAGKTVFRQAIQFLQSKPTLKIEEGEVVVISFATQNVDCRYLQGVGLDGVIASVPNAALNAKFVVAGVLAYQEKWGVIQNLPAELLPKVGFESGAPRTRAEVLKTTLSLVIEMISVGLSHLPNSYESKSATLSVSALAVSLPRLSLALRRIARHVSLLDKRDARADESALLLLLAQTYALVESLLNSGANPRPELLGSHRTNYQDVGHLELFGVGAQEWRTYSGYVGLSVFFWSNERQTMYSWTEARTSERLGDFLPTKRYNAQSPWEGASSLKQISRSKIKLFCARLNATGRLSSSSKSRVSVIAPTEISELNFGLRSFTNWNTAKMLAAKRLPLGLSERNPLEEVIVLQVAVCGDRSFDSIAQRFIWELIDSEGDVLALELSYSDLTKTSISLLEKLELPPKGTPLRILGQLNKTQHGWRVSPISLLLDEAKTRIVNISLDSTPNNKMSDRLDIVKESQTERIELSEEEQFEEEVSSDTLSSAALPSTTCPTILPELKELLLSLAERGTNSASGQFYEQLANTITHLTKTGLPVLAHAATKLQNAQRNNTARELLRLVYISKLHGQANIASA